MTRPGKRLRVTSRLCRLDCGTRFKLELPSTPDTTSMQTCPTCRPVLKAAVEAIVDPERLGPFGANDALGLPGDPRTGAPLFRNKTLLKRIRRYRAKFEAAWRLGADRKTLRQILHWNHQESRP
jgi:hypothetical protein